MSESLAIVIVVCLAVVLLACALATAVVACQVNSPLAICAVPLMGIAGAQAMTGQQLLPAVARLLRARVTLGPKEPAEAENGRSGSPEAQA